MQFFSLIMHTTLFQTVEMMQLCPKTTNCYQCDTFNITLLKL